MLIPQELQLSLYASFSKLAGVSPKRYLLHEKREYISHNQ